MRRVPERIDPEQHRGTRSGELRAITGSTSSGHTWHAVIQADTSGRWARITSLELGGPRWVDVAAAPSRGRGRADVLESDVVEAWRTAYANLVDLEATRAWVAVLDDVEREGASGEYLVRRFGTRVADPLKRADLEVVTTAAVYLQLVDLGYANPRQGVARALNLSTATATRRIREARDAGLIPSNVTAQTAPGGTR